MATPPEALLQAFMKRQAQATQPIDRGLVPPEMSPFTFAFPFLQGGVPENDRVTDDNVNHLLDQLLSD